MKIIKKTLVVLVLCSFIMGTVPISVLAQQNSFGNQTFENTEPYLPSGVECIPDEIIVKYKSETSDETISAINSKNKVVSSEKIMKQNQKAVENEKTKILKKNGLDRIYLLKLPKQTDINKIINSYKKNSNVEYAEPNYIVHMDTIPNDHNSSLWGLDNTGQTGGTPDADIDAPEAWDIQTGNANVVVAVIDTGVDYDHEDITANMWTNLNEIPGNSIDDDSNGFVDDVYGWDFYNDDNNPFDDHGHGTHCSGTIAAVGNNSVGIVGVNWEAKIMALKFLGADGSGSTWDAIDAITYVIIMKEKGVPVIAMSNSWGGGGYVQAMEDAISAANEAGILFIAAAGNSGHNNDIVPHYPSSYNVPNVISVAATDHTDARASFSNYGVESVDLGAPGVSIYSTLPGDSYASWSGTSMATPHVAGTVALIKAQHPTLTSDSIKARILYSVDPVPSLAGITSTGGRLNVNNAFENDNIPPSEVNDLAASNRTFDSMDLTWTATGDDAGSETASFYDIRYSTSEITDANWDMATHVSGEPKPQPSGSTETYTVTGLSDITLYYFAIKVLDNVGNPSGLSNVVSETTTTFRMVFQDNMESGINEWNYESLWHKETYRSSSSITSWAYNTGDPNYNYDTGNNKGNLTSPVIDLSDYNSTFLIFEYWYQTETSGTSRDKRCVQIGVDGIFTDIAQLSEDPMLMWNQYILDISSYTGNSNVQVRFFFDTIDGLNNNNEGWYIDNIAIFGEFLGSNNPPVADTQSVATDEDTPLPITLAASDPDGDTLIYYIVSFPSNGTLSGTAPDVKYTPNPDYNGPDSFAFKANDWIVDSNMATVTITINPITDPPVADAGSNQSAAIGEKITFDGSNSYDPDDDSLNYHWDFGDGSIATGINPTHTYSEVGSYVVNLTVNDSSATDSDTAIVDVYNYIDDLINADIPVKGKVTGNHLNTHESDNMYESITEVESGGKPSNRYSYLEHKWMIDVIGGNSVTFNVEAHHILSSDGDDFVFGYSTDDNTYTDIMTITKIVDDNTTQTCDLPNDLSGTVYIRVRDTDQVKGNRLLDTIFIDQMFIRSESSPPSYGVTVTIDEVSQTVAPGNSTNYTVRTKNTGDLEASYIVNMGGTTVDDSNVTVSLHNWSTGTLAPNTEDVTTVTVFTTESTPETTYTLTATASCDQDASVTDSATSDLKVSSETNTMHVASIDMSSSKKIAGPNFFTRVIAIVSIVDTNGIPVSGATVSGNWSIATFDSDSEMTDTNGNISLYSDEVKNAPSGTNFTFTVDNVVGGLTYNRDGNIETTDNIVV